MNYKILFACILLPLGLKAQNCDRESLLQKPGTWKAGMKGSQLGSAADLAREKKVVAVIHEMIQSKYTPAAVEAIYHGTYGTDQSAPANNYMYSIIPLNYYCDGNLIKTNRETSTYFSIGANFIDAGIYETLDFKGVASGAGFHFIHDIPVEKDGYLYFPEKDASLGFGMTGKTYAWLITYPGKLPFAYVTKKEFLQAQKIILANAQREAESGFRDVLSRIEIEKGFREKEYKNDPEKLKNYMKMDYNETKLRYEKLLADNAKSFKPALDKIESKLKLPEQELSRQAIVKQDPNDHLSYLFTDDNDPLGLVLIKPNREYFNPKLPRSSPQFFYISVRGNHKEEIAARFIKDIMQAIDFTKLKNMLGK